MKYKSTRLNAGDIAEFWGNETGTAGEKCEIVTRKITQDDLDGFVAVEAAGNRELAERIYRGCGVDLRNGIEEQADFASEAEERNFMTITNELDSMCGISDEELTHLFKESIRIDDEIRRIKGLPVARYDSVSRKAYLEYPDGRRKYVGDK